MAVFAVEVRVLVVVVMVVVAVAEFIAQAVAILNGVHQVLLAEERQRPEDVRLVYGPDEPLQFGKRQWSHGRSQGFRYDNAVGCGLDAVQGEKS